MCVNRTVEERSTHIDRRSPPPPNLYKRIAGRQSCVFV